VSRTFSVLSKKEDIEKKFKELANMLAFDIKEKSICGKHI
jgi:hypothetical protein